MFHEIAKVLLITTSHVGNAIFCTPSIRLLKKHCPHLSIDVVTMHPRAASVFLNNPDIQTVYLKKNKRALQKLIKNYSLSVCLNYASKTDYLEGFSENIISIGPSNPVIHRAEEILLFMKSLIDCKLTDEDQRYYIYPDHAAFIQMQRYVPAAADTYYIGLHVGTSRTQIHGWKFWYKKRTQDPRLWPIDHYIALAKYLKAADPRLRFVLTGEKSERFLGKQFCKAIPDTINLMGKTSLPELSALMTFLQIFITHDTGVLHVAVAMQVPLVSLFGPTDPLRTGPYPFTDQTVVIQKSQIVDIQPAEVGMAVIELFKSLQAMVVE